MKEINLKLKIITPLFMGGAKQQAELRTQSFNGFFRYWFRITGGNKEEEKLIFEWGGEKGCKKLINLYLENPKLKKKYFSKIFDNRGNVDRRFGLNYIGFSLDQRFKINQKKLQREYLDINQFFNLKIKIHPKAKKEEIKKFLCSVWLAFNLGNFGSRARRGFGSVKIEKIDGDLPENLDLQFIPSQDVENWIKNNLEVLKNIICGYPREDLPYIFDKNNFSIYKVNKYNWQEKLNRFLESINKNRKGKWLPKPNEYLVNTINSPIWLLDFMSFLLMSWRSYYQPDYINVKTFLIKGTKKPLIKKTIFGLPLKFYFSSYNLGVTVNLESEKRNKKRNFKESFTFMD